MNNWVSSNTAHAMSSTDYTTAHHEDESIAHGGNYQVHHPEERHPINQGGAGGWPTTSRSTPPQPSRPVSVRQPLHQMQQHQEYHADDPPSSSTRGYPHSSSPWPPPHSGGKQHFQEGGHMTAHTYEYDDGEDHGEGDYIDEEGDDPDEDVGPGRPSAYHDWQMGEAEGSAGRHTSAAAAAAAAAGPQYSPTPSSAQKAPGLLHRPKHHVEPKRGAAARGGAAADMPGGGDIGDTPYTPSEAGGVDSATDLSKAGRGKGWRKGIKGKLVKGLPAPSLEPGALHTAGGEVRDGEMEDCFAAGLTLTLPCELFTLPSLGAILNLDTWHNVLSESEREQLRSLLPPGMTEEEGGDLDMLLGGEENFYFGSATASLWQDLTDGECHPRVVKYRQGMQLLHEREHWHRVREHHNSVVHKLMKMAAPEPPPPPPQQAPQPSVRSAAAYSRQPGNTHPPQQRRRRPSAQQQSTSAYIAEAPPHPRPAPAQHPPVARSAASGAGRRGGRGTGGRARGTGRGRGGRMASAAQGGQRHAAAPVSRSKPAKPQPVVYERQEHYVERDRDTGGNPGHWQAQPQWDGRPDQRRTPARGYAQDEHAGVPESRRKAEPVYHDDPHGVYGRSRVQGHEDRYDDDVNEDMEEEEDDEMLVEVPADIRMGRGLGGEEELGRRIPDDRYYGDAW